MSPSDGSALFPLLVTVVPGSTLEKEEIRVRILNHQNQQVHEGFGDLLVELPMGIYTVRIEFGSQWRDEIVRHADGNTHVTLELPERPSPVPVFGTSTAHEYYSYTSSKISKDAGGGNSGIFLFIRAHDAAQYNGADLWNGLRLLDAQGRRILAFGPAHGEMNSQFGYYGATVPLPPGMYILKNTGELPREMPIYVFGEWQTQLFVFFRERRLFESATILMNHWGAGFNPEDRETDAIDMALRGLQSDADVLPNRMLNTLLMGKFENPMLGFLGAHFLLRQKRPDQGLLDTVLHNLNYLLPGSPDVAALAVMARANFGMQLGFGPVQQPPMMRSALEALYDLSARREEYSELIPPGSLLETIAPRRYIDSAYTSWQPEKRVRGDAVMAPKDGSAPVETWIVEYLIKQKEAAEISEAKIDLHTYARRLNLPLRTIEAAWKILNG